MENRIGKEVHRLGNKKIGLNFFILWALTQKLALKLDLVH